MRFCLRFPLHSCVHGPALGPRLGLVLGPGLKNLNRNCNVYREKMMIMAPISSENVQPRSMMRYHFRMRKGNAIAGFGGTLPYGTLP